MIDLIPARPEMAALFTPQRDQIATGQVMTPEAISGAISGGLALACVDGPRILALGGILEQWENRGLVWGLLAEGIGATMTPIHRITKRALAASPLRRIEAHVAVEHAAGHRWIAMLGFEREGTMRAFWQGHDYTLYARVL